MKRITETTEDEQPTRKVGRPRNPNRANQQKNRRFIQLEKTPETLSLMDSAHAAYTRKHGRDTTDAEIIREALRIYRSE